MKLHVKGDEAELAHFAQELGVRTIEIEQIWHWGAFNRMLAKIVHAFCVRETGLEGAHFYLIPIILGLSPYFSHYIEGVESCLDELQPPNVLGIGLRLIRNVPHVFVRIGLLGDQRFPTYEVVVGRATDPRLILRKIDRAAQR